MKLTRKALLELLQDAGPQPSVELARYFPGSDRSEVSSALHQMHRSVAEQQVHIAGWTRDADGAKRHLRALYAAGPGKDAPKPRPLTGRQRERAYRARRKLPAGVPNSVWQLGASL